VAAALEGVGSVGPRKPGAENLRPMLAGGIICNRENRGGITPEYAGFYKTIAGILQKYISVRLTGGRETKKKILGFNFTASTIHV